MSGHARLVELVNDELDECAGLLGRIEDALRLVEDAHHGIHIAVAVAAYIENLFTAIERILLRLVDNLDGQRPRGEAWHLELLLQAAREVPGKRGQILRPTTVETIDEWRKFRHLVRHGYVTRLRSNEVEVLGYRVVAGFQAVRDDVLVCIQQLPADD